MLCRKCIRVLLKRVVGPVKRVLAEKLSIFLYIAKWFILAVAVGLLVGVIVSAFIWVLDFSLQHVRYFSRSFHHNIFSPAFLLLPVGMVISSLIGHHLSSEAGGHGTERVIQAMNENYGRVDVRTGFWRFVASVITISAGGSAGRAGPAAHLGAAVSTFLSRLLKLSTEDSMKLVACGVSASFAGVFGAPIAGSIFGLEVLFLKGKFYELLFPAMVAGITSFQVTELIGVVSPLSLKIPFPSYVPEPVLFLKSAIFGVLIGILVNVFVLILAFFRWLSSRIRIYPPVKAFLAGFALMAMAELFGMRFLGHGADVVYMYFQGFPEVFRPLDFLVKMLFTALTLSFGGSGGIITPIFFIGASAGDAFGRMMGTPSFFAALGLVSFLAGSANTPVSAVVLAMELFGSRFGLFAGVAVMISYLTSGHVSVFPSQFSYGDKAALGKINFQTIKKTIAKRIKHTNTGTGMPR